jgi:alpha-N-acetylglucosaminidase
MHGHPGGPGGGHHGHGGHGFLFATGVSFDWAVGDTEGETAESPAAQRAWDVVHRTIGDRAEAFDLFLATPRKDGFDEFTVSANAGHVAVVGTSPVALCRGAYEYLKTACHIQVNWSESNLRMPAALPDFAPYHVVCPNRYRLYYNICTFGYSTVWWDWKRWRREVDWMALHGINMPLALNGQEFVWQRVFRGLKIPDASISRFFSGPAFLPWHWMGNLNGHGGPMPQSWIDGQAGLEHEILNAERELGMSPIVSGFSGFVPVDFAKYHPEVKLSSPTAWAGFAPTTFVDVRSPMFVEIGRRYVQEYRREFGPVHFYLCDTFNEQNPQFPKATELSDISACGRSVYKAIHAADPTGTWVMQGWLFRNEAEYWTLPRVEALMRDVPKGKMIVLDLDTADAPVWKRLPPVRDGGWIYNTLHNYGQNTALTGDLQHFADRAASDLNDPHHGDMLGMGLTMEGIDQNPVVYEMLTDAMWRPDRIQIEGDRHSTGWIEDYVASRYGLTDYRDRDAAYKAWKLIVPTIYGRAGGSDDGAWRYRPSLSKIAPPSVDVGALRQAVTYLCDVRAHEESPLLDRDLVDVTKTWLGALADIRLVAAVATFDRDKGAYATNRDAFLGLLHELDRVMAVMPEHRLSTWIADARAWGRTPAERDLMEWNARMQVTIWGGPELFDYANKEWAGLNEDFIRHRWELFFSALDKAGSANAFKPPDFAAWETKWTENHAPVRESLPEPPVPLVRGLLVNHPDGGGDLASLLGLDADPGIAVGAKVWDSGHTEGDHVPQLAVDGRPDGGYWAASPAPQWLEIDLGAPKAVRGTWLFPYYGDGRVYTYRVGLSLDGEHWQAAADGSGNTSPATFAGYRDTWTPIVARYVRVTMLHNSANIGVHLYEVRVLGGKN